MHDVCSSSHALLNMQKCTGQTVYGCDVFCLCYTGSCITMLHSLHLPVGTYELDHCVTIISHPHHRCTCSHYCGSSVRHSIYRTNSYFVVSVLFSNELNNFPLYSGV